MLSIVVEDQDRPDLELAYKLLEAAQARWRCVNGAQLVALVRAGATFVDGVKVEREDRRSAA